MAQRAFAQPDLTPCPALVTLGGAELFVPASGARLLGPGKPLALLLYLHCSPGRAASRDHLIDLLWADQDPSRARPALRQTAHRLRQLLGTDAFDSRGDDLVLTLHLICDRDAFLGAVTDADFDRAVALYGGPFFEGFATPGGAEFEHWADGERRRLRRLFIRAAESVTRAALTAGRHREAIRLARRVRDSDPDAESGWRLLLEALIAAREPLQLEVEIHALQDQLAADDRQPEPATRALLDLARGEEQGPAAPAERGLVAELVGREREFGAIVAAWAEAKRGQPRHLHLEAPAGLGKTRLLRDAGARLRASRARVLLLRANPGERDLAWSFAADCVAALAALPGAGGVSEGTAGALVTLRPALAAVFPRARLAGHRSGLRLERTLALIDLVNAIAHEQPVVLLIDDIHWLDRESYEVLRGVIARLGSEPVLVVTAGRPSPDRGLETPTTIRLSLPELGREHVVGILASLGSLPSVGWGEQVAAAVQRSAHGSPLLVLETLQRAIETDDLRLDAIGWSAPDLEALLSSLQAGGALRHRLLELPDEERRLLLLLAVAGTPVEGTELTAAIEAETTATLLALERRGLVARVGTAWTVGHDEIGETVRRVASREEGERAHAALGRALASVAGNDPTVMRRAARHLLAGGVEPELREVVRRGVASARRRGEGRSAEQVVADLLGETASTDRVRALTGTLPLRLRLDWRRAAVAAGVLLLAGFGLRAVLAPAPAPEAILGVGFLRDGDLVFAALPISLDDWRLDRPLKLASGDIRVRVPRGTEIIDWPAPSPDGSRIAYSRIVNDSGVVDFFLVEAGGAERRLTYTPRDDGHPTWSPDGHLLVFRTIRFSPRDDGNFDLASLDLETGLVRQLTRGRDTDARPLWSPDGTRIAFTRMAADGSPDRLCWVGADGGGERCLSDGPAPQGPLVGWASAEEVLVIVGRDSLARVRLETGETAVTLIRSVPPLNASPGGEWLAGLVPSPGAGADPGPEVQVAPTGRPELARRVALPARHGSRPFWWPVPSASRGWLDHLTMTPAGDSLPVGIDLRFAVSGRSASGMPMAVPPAVVRWSTGDTTVAVIDSVTGVLTARKPGRVWVTVSAGGWRRDSARLGFVPAASHPLMAERWSDTSLAAWQGYGDPLPMVVQADDGEPAFWHHGDDTWLSGAFSRHGYRSPSGIGAEFLVSMPVFRDKWQRLKVELAEVIASGASATAGAQCAFTYPRGEGSEARRWIAVSAGAVSSQVPTDPTLASGGWHRVRIQLLPDGSCAISLDGRMLASLDARLPLDRDYHVVIEGQSHLTRLLVKGVDVWAGVR